MEALFTVYGVEGVERIGQPNYLRIDQSAHLRRRVLLLGGWTGATYVDTSETTSFTHTWPTNKARRGYHASWTLSLDLILGPYSWTLFLDLLSCDRP
jgi:hypothetical protein